MKTNLKRQYPRNVLIDIMILTGLLLITWSFVSELYFHFIADFTLDNINPDVFWRAENSELVNSIFLLVSGGFFLTLGLLLKFNGNKRPRKTKY